MSFIMDREFNLYNPAPVKVRSLYDGYHVVFQKLLVFERMHRGEELVHDLYSRLACELGMVCSSFLCEYRVFCGHVGGNVMLVVHLECEDGSTVLESSFTDDADASLMVSLGREGSLLHRCCFDDNTDDLDSMAMAFSEVVEVDE